MNAVSSHIFYVSRFHEPLLPPVCAFAAGIAAARSGFVDVSYLAPGLVAASLLLCLAAILARRIVFVPLLASAALSGAIWYELHEGKPIPELDAEPGETVLFYGCIGGPPESDGPVQRFTVELEPGANVRITLVLRDGEPPPALEYGRVVEVEAKLRKPHNFRNPGNFDYVSHLQRQHVYWLASARGAKSVQLSDQQCGSRAGRYLAQVRSWALARLAGLYGDQGYAAALMPALLIGDDARVQKGWTEPFRVTGTYHALVISGLHITVVAGLVYAVFRRTGAPLSLALGIGVCAAWLYAGVANWEAPAVRSAAGFSLFLLGRVFHRRGRLLNILAATAIVFLVSNPNALFDPSFQLSFLAVAGLGGLALPFAERTYHPFRDGLRGLNDSARDLRHSPNVAQFRIELRLLAETLALLCRVPSTAAMRLHSTAATAFFFLAGLAVVTFFVQLALAVPSIVYFHRVPVTGIPANLVVPVALTLAIPLGLLAILTNSAFLAFPARLCLDIAQVSAEFFGGLEPLWRVPDPPWYFCALFCLASCFLAVSLRQGRAIALAASTCALAAALLLVQPFHVTEERGELSISTLDVGQGDSLFVSLPDGRTMLIDAGGLPTYSAQIPPRLDVGEDVVSPYLWHKRYRKLDIVAVTHLHDDHAGGVPAIIRNFHPAEVWVGAVSDCPAWQRIQAAARSTGTRIRILRAGDTQRFGSASVQTLAPASDYTARLKPHNDDSLVLLMKMGRHTFLLTGDMEHRGEAMLTAAGSVPDVDVLKVGHHGSRASTTEQLLDAARPRFALISSGVENTYGHPHPAVLDRLWRLGTQTYRTDKHGMVRVTSNGRHLRIETAADYAQTEPSLPGLRLVSR